MKKVKLHIIAVSILLLASSRLLFSQIPVYVSSIVEDANPSVIIMTFNTSLANSVPAPSAFVATVNTDPRNNGIIAISISGDKVSLTLVEPIIHFGDVVTIDYIKPTQNPLQSLSGGQVASFYLQPVINHCLQKDIDGNNYNTVEIGRQIWMVENLKTTHFRDGSAISLVTGDNDWAGLNGPGYCWYNNNENSYKSTYGGYYNWFAVNSGLLCPSGWHVPTDAEWHQLVSFLDPISALINPESLIAGDKLKESGATHWLDNNSTATNESGFTALPGAFRYGSGYGNGSFYYNGQLDIGKDGFWWTSTSDDGVNSWYRNLRIDYSGVYRSYFNYTYGLPVRCLSNFLKPTLATVPVPASSIQANSATSGGTDIDEDGQPIAVKGVCWSTSHNPTILDSHTIDGYGPTNFTSTMTGLAPNTTYYVRAFTFNYVGTSYGNEISFVTKATLPTVTTLAISDIKPISAIGGGDVTSDGGSPVTVKGILWNTEGNPTYLVDKGCQAGSMGTGSFVAYVSGALPFTPYYVRAFAVNGVGVAYGQEVTFTTTQSFDPVVFNKDIKYGIVHDIEGNSYKTIQIGTLAWMAENLKTTIFNNGLKITNITDQTQWESQDGTPGNTTPAYCWYDNNASICKDVFGALYNWYAASNDNLCPVGWRVPTYDEWTTLFSSLGGIDKAGNLLKETGNAHWATPNPGATNSTGFTALGGGIRGTGAFSSVAVTGFWWSRTGIGTTDAWNINLNSGSGYVGSANNLKRSGMSIRCIKEVTLPTVSTAEVTAITPVSAASGGTIVSDGGAAITERGICWSTSQDPTTSNGKAPDNAPVGESYTLSFNSLLPNTHYYVRAYAINSLGTTYGSQMDFTTTQAFDQIGFDQGSNYGTVKDVEGNNYRTIQIGTQVWMAENLKTKKFNNNVNIPLVSDNTAWTNLTTPGYCWYGNNETLYGSTFGALYNWYTVNTNNLCPIGWHVPSKDDWTSLQTFLGDGALAGGKLKEAGMSHWVYPNTGANNETGFTALPGGLRPYDTGISDNVGYMGFFWTSTENDASNSWYESLVCNNSGLWYGFENKKWGFSVRCLANPVLMVTNINDIGPGSLRDAIATSNTSVNAIETIKFNIPGSGPFTIQPHSPLPIIEDPVVIDGYSQPGASESNAIHLIELDGTNSGTNANGLTISADNCVVKGLIINRFGEGGIKINENFKGNKIAGNYIGTDINGTISLGNGSGIMILGSDENIIGGATIADRNIISGNKGCGIFNHVGSRNYYLGNFIGVDASGKLPLGNKGIGLYLAGGSENTIGGSNLNERNVISSNEGDGISFANSAHACIMKGNFIGVDASGQLSLGNSGNGVSITSVTTNTIIGGINSGEGNIIAFNSGSGIYINHSGTSNNSIIANSIYSNGGLGINLVGGNENANGVTGNDGGDGDSGPNNLQNFPILTSLSFTPGYVSISGSLNSESNKKYTLQFFANKVADGSNYGEGQTYLYLESESQQPIPIEVTTDGNGNAPFTTTLPIKGIYGQVISATATDPAGNTSEFSEYIGGLSDQVVGMNWPVRYVYNPVGAEKITDGTDIKAITNSFDTWSNISTAKTKFVVSAGSADMVNAVAGDGINLVSFMDTEYDWPEGVLAYASKTTEMDEGGVNGKITDADIIVNPAFKDVLKGTTGLNGETGTTGFYDIQSIITHEIGHTIGLLHSGLTRSTMFFWMNKGSIGKRTLESDDIAWTSYKYPGTQYSSTFGTISGNIKYGYGPDPNNLDPVVGALVTAINTLNGISFHSYSDAVGHYQIPVLSGSNQYYIHIQPLDGDVGGYPMTPANISSYIYSNTVYTDYPEEYYNINDNDGGSNPAQLTDNETNKDPVPVSGIANIITNRDITPPEVASVTPDKGSFVKVLPDIIITFSEPVDLTSFTDASCFLQIESGTKYSGSVSQWEGNTASVIFTPYNALLPSLTFTLHLNGITDLKGNKLSPEYTDYSITTIDPDITPPRVTSSIPGNGVSGVFVTDKMIVSFSEPVNKATVQPNYTFTSGGIAVACSLSWSDNGSTVTFTPENPLIEGKNYKLSLDDDITDLNGVHLLVDANDPNKHIYEVNFTTVSDGNPTTTYIGPKASVIDVPVNTPVVIDFSEPIITSIFDLHSPDYDPDAFKLQVKNGASISGSFEVLNEDSRVVFRPNSDLSFGTTYEIVLTTKIQDKSGNGLVLEDKFPSPFTTSSKPLGPSIEYIEKPTGVVGDEVIISGKGFDPVPAKNMVSFAGVTAPVETATLTSLNVAVPTGTVSGEVTVTVNSSKSEGFNFVIVKASDALPSEWATSNSNIGNGTHSMALNGDCTTAFITNSGSNTVSVVDINDKGELNYLYDIPVGQIPMDIALNSTDTRAYVTNYGSHTVSVIDLTKSPATEIKQINVGINPYGIAVVPDGDFVYVANYTSQNLSVIDVNPNSGGFDHATSSVDLKTGGKGTAITGDAGLVLVATDDGLKIININPQSKEYCFNCIAVTGSSGTKITKVDVTGDAGYAIATTEDGRILLIDVLPGSDYFGTAVTSTSSNTKITGANNGGDGLHVYATTENHEVLIFEIGEGGSTIPGVEGSSTGTKNLKLVGKIPDVGNDAAALDALNQRILTADSQLNPNGSISGKAWSTALYVPPQQPVDRINGLILNVQELMYGSLKRSIGNALISYLNSAINYINAKKNKDAINRLNTFIVNLKDMIKSQKNLTPDEKDKAQDMINTAYEIIAQLKGTKAGDEITITGIDNQSNQDIITLTKLGSIYPNPTKNAITINYEVASDDLNSGKVMIQVFDVTGRLVGNLVNRTHEAGRYSVTWNGYYENGAPAPRGIYYIRFTAGSKKEVQHVMLVR
jgi:uncharacterized protein (TIGR02145 family)